MNVIRAIATMLLVACAAPRTTAAPPRPAPTAAPVDDCPRRTMGVTPEVVIVSSLAAAKPHLAAVVDAANEDLDQLAAEHGKAFGVRVLRGAFHGSDSFLYDISAVFVLDDRVVVAKRLAIDASVIPGPGSAPKPTQTNVEILSPTIGHVQIARGDVSDHFIDLERGAHLMALTSSTPRAWTLDGDSGPVSGDCHEWWDE